MQKDEKITVFESFAKGDNQGKNFVKLEEYVSLQSDLAKAQERIAELECLVNFYVDLFKDLENKIESVGEMGLLRSLTKERDQLLQRAEELEIDIKVERGVKLKAYQRLDVKDKEIIQLKSDLAIVRDSHKRQGELNDKVHAQLKEAEKELTRWKKHFSVADETRQEFARLNNDLEGQLAEAEKVIEFYSQKTVPDIHTEFAKSAGQWGEHVVTWEPLTDMGNKAREYLAKRRRNG